MYCQLTTNILKWSFKTSNEVIYFVCIRRNIIGHSSMPNKFTLQTRKHTRNLFWQRKSTYKDKMRASYYFSLLLAKKKFEGKNMKHPTIAYFNMTVSHTIRYIFTYKSVISIKNTKTEPFLVYIILCSPTKKSVLFYSIPQI